MKIDEIKQLIEDGNTLSFNSGLGVGLFLMYCMFLSEFRIYDYVNVDFILLTAGLFPLLFAIINMIVFYKMYKPKEGEFLWKLKKQ